MILILFVGSCEIILKFKFYFKFKIILKYKYNLYYKFKKYTCGLTNFLMFFDRLFNIHLVEC